MKIRKILLCMLLSALLLVGASAATWHEMQENGAVSDDGIRLGDARDGIVSDVSEEHEDGGIIGDIITDITGALDGTQGGNESDHILGPTVPETTAAPNTTAPTTTSGTSANGEDGGMSMGVIIAILVVIAVIAVIFMLLPKRK